jgi:mRNA-degrading endonuclease toxin of MazEF toxin-antitoxin module
MSHSLSIGDVIAVTLPTRTPSGHEQERLRPAVIIGLPGNVDTPRYPVIIAIPLTTKSGIWSSGNNLYLEIIAGEANLRKDSIALTDQLLSIDTDRINGFIGTLNQKNINLLKRTLKKIFEF